VALLPPSDYLSIVLEQIALAMDFPAEQLKSNKLPEIT
jgi:hypothetical protein